LRKADYSAEQILFQILFQNLCFGSSLLLFGPDWTRWPIPPAGKCLTWDRE